MRSFSFFPPLFKDEKIENSVMLKDSSSYEMRGALPLSQKKYAQFKTQDNRVYD